MKTRQPCPLYPNCNRSQILTAWCGAVANGLVIIWLALWLVAHSASIEPNLLELVTTVFIALFVSDFLSGFVHWAVDTWFDERNWVRVISIAREHHLFPHHIIGYPFRDYVAFSSWPTVLIVGPCGLLLTLAAPAIPLIFYGVVICLITSAVMFFGTHAHRLGHRPSRLRIVRLLQACHLLITTGHHGAHHRASHNRRYCVINGWANYVCDGTGFWRALELLIQQLTGSVPRRNDLEWLARHQHR
jgi:ubiquitin-conjugating enzyme E2 variant